ncbi:MAG TPA: hypothetical protein VLJ79_27155 [Candidatus Binatia bacterium]|nr:hypothetical protein [Candidatus Binatia bacterium]
MDSYLSISNMPVNDAIRPFQHRLLQLSIFSRVELTIVQDGEGKVGKKPLRPRDRPPRATGVYFR